MGRADRPAKGIYWDRSWNPFTGCSPVGDGCLNCWAKRTAEGRLRGRCGYPADEPFRPTFHPERLSQVNSKQKPQVIATCFMSDPFHEEHDPVKICDMMDAIIECSQHTFIALTKRPEAMKPFLDYYPNPIPNLIGGVSVWDQESADRMIPILLGTNLATRIVSLEPCLEAVNLAQIPTFDEDNEEDGLLFPLAGEFICEGRNEPLPHKDGALDGVILGGESGPGARPMHPDWARSVRDQCQAAGVPFLFKQWEEWAPGYNKNKLNCCISNHHSPNLEMARYQKKKGQYLLDDPICMEPDRSVYGAHSHPYREQCERMTRVGKKAAGRLLDGVEHNELPEMMK